MIVNAVINAWQKRTGSDAAGQPAFAAQTLPVPVACWRTGLSISQQASLAAVGISADEQVIFRSASPEALAGSLAIEAGDRVGLDDPLETFKVVKTLSVDKGPLSQHTLWLRRLVA